MLEGDSVGAYLGEVDVARWAEFHRKVTAEHEEREREREREGDFIRNNVHNGGSWARSGDRRCITLCGKD